MHDLALEIWDHVLAGATTLKLPLSEDGMGVLRSTSGSGEWYVMQLNLFRIWDTTSDSIAAAVAATRNHNTARKEHSTTGF